MLAKGVFFLSKDLAKATYIPATHFNPGCVQFFRATMVIVPDSNFPFTLDTGG